MGSLVVANGTVLTMNEHRDLIEDGAVAVENGEIVAVGETADIVATHEAEELVDASGHVVLPGLIDAHVHVNDILLRGLGKERGLYDWVLNVNKPGVGVLTPADHEISAALYCLEAIRSGITLFVDNAAGSGPGMWLDADARDARLDVYDTSGIRAVFAQEFVDQEIGRDERFEHYSRTQRAKSDRSGDEIPPIDTAEAIDRTEALIADYHGTAEGRLSVWPAPIYPWAVSETALTESERLARTYDVMTSTHVSEVDVQERFLESSVEYLNNIGYLGPNTLLGHCVHLDERDIRLLATSDTKVSHNVMTNLALGSGFAPVPTMQNYGVTVGLGTDNASASDTVNLVSDMRVAATVHKADRLDPGAMTAETVVEMVTIDGARAVGRESELGSLEPGKRADMVLFDLEHPNMTPVHNVASAIVHQASGHEVDTVICEGEVVMADRDVRDLEAAYPNLRENARSRAKDIVERAGLTDLRNRPWTSISAE